MSPLQIPVRLHTDPFWEFVKERQRILLAKKDHQAIYTNDPILQKYHFCNIYRDDDPGTQFFLKNMSLDLEECYFQATFYRMLNNRTVCEKIGGLPTKQNHENYMKDLRKIAKNQPVFSKAFRTLCNVPEGAKRHEVLIDFTEEWFKQGYPFLMAQDLLETHHFKNAFQVILHSWKFIGEFLAFQILLDVMHHSTMKEIQEDDSWTLAGPGACAGLLALADIYNQEWDAYKSSILRGKCEKHIKDLYGEMPQKLGEDFPRSFSRLPWIHDIESCLCEYGKYKKFQLGKPCARRFYKPSTLLHV